MKAKRNTRKIWAAVFIVALFLISSMIPVSAGLSDGLAGFIEKVKPVDGTSGAAEQKPIPTLDNTKSNDIFLTANNELNLIGMQQQDQLQIQSYQQPSTAKKYAVIMVGRYAGLRLLNFGGSVTNFLTYVNQSYYWFLKAAGMMYNTLHDTYGYGDDSIFLLVHLLPVVTWKGKTYFNTIPPQFNSNWIDCESTKEDLEAVLSTFKPEGTNALNDQDQLFFSFIDHGANVDDNYAGDDYYVNEFIGASNYINTNWINEENAYDYSSVQEHLSYHNIGTDAIFKRLQSGWSDPLTLTLDEPTNIKGFRISAKSYKDLQGNQIYLDKMKLELYDGNTLKNTSYFTSWPDSGYIYKELDNKEEVNKVKITFHLTDGTFFVHRAKVYDFNFWTAEWDNCGEVGRHTYFGCPFLTVPEYLRPLWSILFGGDDSENLLDHDLYDYIYDINQNAKIIFALQPCMSGGFISELSGPNHIVCTASRGCEVADASWIEPFTWALDGTYGDPNNDGKISILEAYELAAQNVANQLNNHPEFPPQHPLIDDNGPEYVGYWDMSFGVGHHFSETDYYDPNDPAKDGHLAAQTFL